MDQKLSKSQYSRLIKLGFEVDPVKEQFKRSVKEFLKNSNIDWIVRNEMKEGYFLKKKLNKIYEKLDPSILEELARKIFERKI